VGDSMGPAPLPGACTTSTASSRGGYLPPRGRLRPRLPPVPTR
jgi:hypothetical protein